MAKMDQEYHSDLSGSVNPSSPNQKWYPRPLFWVAIYGSLFVRLSHVFFVALYLLVSCDI